MTTSNPASAVHKRCLAGAALLACLLGAAVGTAHAQDCKADLEALVSHRIAAMNDLNALAKRGKGKLDPVAACPKLHTLVAAEANFVKYLKDNKDWCSIPDQAITVIAASEAKSTRMAAQACGLAAQAKKMLEMAKRQAQQGSNVMADRAPKLPTGPL